MYEPKLAFFFARVSHLFCEFFSLLNEMKKKTWVDRYLIQHSNNNWELRFDEEQGTDRATRDDSVQEMRDEREEQQVQGVRQDAHHVLPRGQKRGA